MTVRKPGVEYLWLRRQISGWWLREASSTDVFCGTEVNNDQVVQKT